jgi:hypothetical protein
MNKFEITKDKPVMFVAKVYPATKQVFKKYNIPWQDQRVPAWMALIQLLAQNNIWYEDGFVTELRTILPFNDSLQKLDDLELVHLKARDFMIYPAVRLLLEKYEVPFRETTVMPWEPIEQAAVRQGIWPVNELVDELNHAAEVGENQ